MKLARTPPPATKISVSASSFQVRTLSTQSKGKANNGILSTDVKPSTKPNLIITPKREHYKVVITFPSKYWIPFLILHLRQQTKMLFQVFGYDGVVSV